MNIDITWAWKDKPYRQSLSTEGYTLPENTVREIELTDDDLAAVYGGCGYDRHRYGRYRHDRYRHGCCHHGHHRYGH